MKEEDNILKKVGKENVFRVPDGYFENLTSEVMSRLPEKETPAIIKREPTKWERIKPWVYMTAMFAGFCILHTYPVFCRNSQHNSRRRLLFLSRFLLPTVLRPCHGLRRKSQQKEKTVE